jgi:LysM domain-containing protein
MRRTTICRSSRAILLTLAAVPLSWTVLRAQDTTQAVPAAAAQLPESHTVVRGETLWSIAQLYFADPLLWPEIYRLNTNVVEDPHWIYPGEVLVLAPVTSVAQGPVTVPQDTSAAAADTVRAQAGDTVAAVPLDTLPADTTQIVIEEPPPSAPITESGQTIFDRRPTKGQEVTAALRAYKNQPYRPLRAGEFYAAGFLSEQERLPWGTVIGSTAVPAITKLSERTTASAFDEIAIKPPGRASYHVGDSVLIARIDRGIQFGPWGEVVVPLGIARVTGVDRQQVLARILQVFGRIRDGHLAMPLEPFKDPGQVRPTPIEQGLVGRLVAPRDEHPIAGAQQFFFINKGRTDGVVPGDIFEVYRPPTGMLGGGSEEVRAVMMIVHTREHSATGLLLQIMHPGLETGMPVRLTKKMPS